MGGQSSGTLGWAWLTKWNQRGIDPSPASELRSCVSLNSLISDRPCHKQVPAQDVAEFLKFKANLLSDPKVMKALTNLHENLISKEIRAIPK